MPHDKPKVTIDLAEYEELKRHSKERGKLAGDIHRREVVICSLLQPTNVDRESFCLSQWVHFDIRKDRNGQPLISPGCFIVKPVDA